MQQHNTFQLLAFCFSRVFWFNFCILDHEDLSYKHENMHLIEGRNAAN